MERLEKEGRGLNLTWEVRQGIVSHSKPRGDFLSPGDVDGLTLEGQVCRISDAVAYLNHDLADAFRAGVLDDQSLPAEVEEVLGQRHSVRIDRMVGDIVASSWAATGEGPGDCRPVITMSPKVRGAVNTLREFMFERVYLPESAGAEGRTAREVVRLLYEHYRSRPGEIPREHHRTGDGEEQAAADYVAGMTDHYALRAAEVIRPGIADIFRSRLVSCGV